MDENSLRLNTCLTQRAFDLHCQMWEMDETMGSIDDHTVMSHEVQTNNWSCQILHHDEMLCENVIPNVKFECGCCCWLLYLAVCYSNLEVRRIINF